MSESTVWHHGTAEEMRCTAQTEGLAQTERWSRKVGLLI